MYTVNSNNDNNEWKDPEHAAAVDHVAGVRSRAAGSAT